MSNRTKLFNNLTDQQVNNHLRDWRDLGISFENNDYMFLDYNNDQDKVDIRKIIRAVHTLNEFHYDNPRLELKRWRQLYERSRKYIENVRLGACFTGRKYMDNAAALYNHRDFTVNYNCRFTGQLTMTTIPGSKPVTSQGVRVFVQLPGTTEHVELSNVTGEVS